MANDTNPLAFDSPDIQQRDLKATLGLPVRFSRYEKKSGSQYFKGMDLTAIRRNLQLFDQLQFISRFQWHNLPEGITSEDIERVLYFRGQGMLYLDNDLGKFYFLPFRLSTDTIADTKQPNAGMTLDFLGKFRRISPLPFLGEASADVAAVEHGKPKKEKTQEEINQEVYLSLITKFNITDVPNLMEMDDAQILNIVANGAVAFYDYTPGLTQIITSRARLNQAFITEMENVIINTKAAILNSTGFQLFALENEEQAQMMQMQLDAITEDRHRGQVSAAVSSLLANARNLQTNVPASIKDFFGALAQWDTYRQQMMGIESNSMQAQGTQYTSIQEVTMNASSTRMIYINGFFERIKSAAIANMIWGLDIYPDPVIISGMSYGMDMLGGQSVMSPKVGAVPTTPAMAGDTEVK